MEPRHVKVFLSSPGDLDPERELVDRVVDRVNVALAGRARFEIFRWEEKHYTAARGFQEQIIDPADCDIVIVMFNQRLGTPLTEFDQRMPDASPYPSGTAYEMLSALDAFERHQKPEVYVFRKTAEPHFSLSQHDRFLAAQKEKARLEEFLEHNFRSAAGGVKRVLYKFHEAPELERHVESVLREWADRNAKLDLAWDYAASGSPFLGLRAFDFRHRAIYFGRERKVKRALQALLKAAEEERGRPFLLVVGASGAGKSSLVRAGVAPALTAPGAVKGVDGWRIAVMRPTSGSTAFLALSQALFANPASDSIEDDPGGYGRALPELAGEAHNSAPSLAELAELLPARAAASVLTALNAAAAHERERLAGARDVRIDLLLIVDQLEEIFEEGISDAQRGAFGKFLLALTETKRVWLVATLRADLYLRIVDARLPFLALKDSGAGYDLASPGEAELIEILQKSAEAAGLVYEADPQRGETLDERLLKDAKGSDDTLPLLQFALDKLFERRKELDRPGGARAMLTHAAYDGLNGLDGAIDLVAESALAEIDPPLAPKALIPTLARLFRRLAVRTSAYKEGAVAGQGLTLRSTYLAEATNDDASLRLVEALIAKHLLVSERSREGEAGTERPPRIRLAHERVLRSWQRAAAIVKQEDEYFRIAADVALDYQRWRDEGGKSERLLIGKSLQDAEWLISAHRNDLTPIVERPGPDGAEGLAAFVAHSGRRARRRQRLVAAAAAVFFVVALVASGLAWVAGSAEREAAENYSAAKSAADDLVSSIARELRDQRGISSKALDVAFGAVDKLLTKIEITVARQDQSFGQGLRTLFEALTHLGQNAPTAADSELSIKLTRATFLYEFAVTYHEAAEDYAKAREKAERSGALLEELRALHPSPEGDDALAKAEMELGDIERKLTEKNYPIQRDGKSAGDFDAARKHYLAADALLKPLLGLTKPRVEWQADRERTLTKLGDLEMLAGRRPEASQLYAKAYEITLQVFHSDPENPVWIRELGWSFRKLGETAATDAEAARMLGDEVCLHRHISTANGDMTKYEEDLGYSLLKEGQALARAKPINIGNAKDAGYEALHVFVDLNDTDRFKASYYRPAPAVLKLLSDAYLAGDDAATSQIFAKASASVSQHIKEAFDTPIGSEAQPGQTAARQTQMKSQGLMAMMDDARPTVANALQSFETSRLGEIRASAQACWDDIKRREIVGSIR